MIDDDELDGGASEDGSLLRLKVTGAEPNVLRRALQESGDSVANIIDVHPLGDRTSVVSADVKGDLDTAAAFRAELRSRLKAEGIGPVRISNAPKALDVWADEGPITRGPVMSALVLPVVIPEIDWDVGGTRHGTGVDEELARAACGFALEGATTIAIATMSSWRLTTGPAAEATVVDLLANDRAGTTEVLAWSDDRIRSAAIGTRIVTVASGTHGRALDDLRYLTTWIEQHQDRLHAAATRGPNRAIADATPVDFTTSSVDVRQYQREQADLLLDVGYCSVLPPALSESPELSEVLEQLPRELHPVRRDRVLLLGSAEDWITDQADTLRATASQALNHFLAR